MGRKTFKAILSYLKKPLSDRTNIIITHNKNFHYPNCVVVNSLDQAIKQAKKFDSDEIFVIGGAQIFNQTIIYAKRLYLTLINKSYDCDVFFPDYSDFTNKIEEIDKKTDSISYKWVVLER